MFILCLCTLGVSVVYRLLVCEFFFSLLYFKVCTTSDLNRSYLVCVLCLSRYSNWRFHLWIENKCSLYFEIQKHTASILKMNGNVCVKWTGQGETRNWNTTMAFKCLLTISTSAEWCVPSFKSCSKSREMANCVLDVCSLYKYL